MTLQDLRAQVAALSSDEKAEMLQLLVADLTGRWPGISKTPGVCGGDACIAGTCIPVWSLEIDRRMGWSDEQIVKKFPTLRANDLDTAWAYVAAHPDEIEHDIRLNDTDEDK